MPHSFQMEHSVNKQAAQKLAKIFAENFRLSLPDIRAQNKLALVFAQRERENVCRSVLFPVFFIYFLRFFLGDIRYGQEILFA